MSTPVRVTEHTTTDDPFLEVENLLTGEVGEFYGSIDEFRPVAERADLDIVEEVWS